MLRLERGSQAKSREKGVQGRESLTYKGPVVGKNSEHSGNRKWPL